MAEPDHIEERVFTLKSAFESHPLYMGPFQVLIKSLQNQENQSSIEEQIRFFTTKHTRYWIMVNMANRILNIKELRLDPTTGRLPSKAHDLLKFMHQGRLALEEESRYKDVLSAVGFMFDMVFYLQRTPILGLGQQKFDEPITQAFTKAVEQAKKAVILNKYKANLDHEKIVPAMPFMRQLAQICICLVNPAQGFEFYKKLDPKLSEPLRMAMEKKTFGVTTATVAAALAECFPIFERLGECMSVWGFPYLAHNKAKAGVEEATAMGMLGAAAVDRLKAEDFAKSGIVRTTMPELRYVDFTFTKEAIVETKI